MPPDEPVDEEREQQLPQDNGTPFQPADPNPSPTDSTNDPVTNAAADGQLPDDHPATDTNVQPEELYDEGVSGAAEAQEPNAGNTVTDYNPANDQRQSDDSSSDGTTTSDGQADQEASDQ